MSSDFSPELQAELLDDFYTECDEHLGNVRTQLAALESSIDHGQANPAALETLYRSVHSFKGNAAIVGLTAAEQLAHAAEGLLRALTRGETVVTPTLLDLIAQTGHRLEEMVAAFRLQLPIPDATAVLWQLGNYDPVAAEAAIHSPSQKIAEKIPDLPDRLRWRATFSPSAERDARGVNIAAVRARLLALGEIVRAAPAIQPGGTMTFEFTLALRAVPTDLETWEMDGVSWQADNASEATEPAAHPGSAAGSMFIAPSHIVRVDLGRLDDLMRIVGEMVIQRSRLEERIAALIPEGGALHEITLGLGRSLRDLRQAITRVRLVPVAEIFSRLPFVVRDLGRDSGKKVRLVLEGQDTEIDKYLVERLKEPLLHLVRNAVTHGVEAPADRQAAGKPPEATLVLQATAVGDTVVIKIRDDGRGVDAERVVSRAADAGLAVPGAPDMAQLLNLLCTSGFSTRDEADRAAGRGVGMAVVASTVRELGGSLALETVRGEGTQFTLRLPLTLSIVETFIVSAGGQTCAVPQGFVEEIIQIGTAEVRTIERVEVVPYRSGVLPLVHLRSIFGAEATVQSHVPVLVVGSDRGSAGLVVDRVHGQREVVVRSMRDPLIHVPGISGATELGDGKPVLILDPAGLTSGAVRPRLNEAVASTNSERQHQAAS